MHRNCPRALLNLSEHLQQAFTGRLRFLSQSASYCQHAASNTGSPSPTPAFAFDIDGVLKRGSQLIPGADEALKQACEWPVVLLTNGGGDTERERASKLSDLLRHKIPDEKLILSHTPMQHLLPQYQDSSVLVVGAGRSLQAAHAYGFSKALSPLQLAAALGPDSAPFSNVPTPGDVSSRLGLPCPVQEHGAATSASPIKAVLVFTDPDDWGRDLQLCCDVMLCGGVLPGLRPDELESLSSTDGHATETPIYFSQDDLLWSNSYQLPRFGLGAFRQALASLYEPRTGRGLPMKGMYGKPTAASFALARQRLDEQARQAGFSHAEPIYMVGDNPDVDIKGANDAKGPWVSVLLRTGVFTGKGNHDKHAAAIVVDNVSDAVSAARHRQRSEFWHTMR